MSQFLPADISLLTCSEEETSKYETTSSERSDETISNELMGNFRDTLNYSFRSHRNRSYQLECELLKIFNLVDGNNLNAIDHYLRNSFEIAEPYRSVTSLLITKCPYGGSCGALKYLSERWKKDREMMKIAIQRDGSQFEEMLPEFKKDKELILMALRNENASLFSKYSPQVVIKQVLSEFSEDIEIVEECCKHKTDCFYYISEKLRDDEGLARVCFSKYCSTVIMDCLSERLKNNRQFISDIVETNPEIVTRCGKEIVDDELMMKALKHGLSLNHLFKSPLLTREIALEYSKTNYWSHIPIQFAKDKEICLQIVNRDGSMLRYLDSEMQKDMDVINVAVKTYPHVFRDLETEEQLKFVESHRETIIDIVQHNSNYHLWELFKDYMGDDLDFYVFAFCKSHSCDLPESLKENREFILKCLRNNRRLDIPQQFKKDPEIISAYWNCIKDPKWRYVWDWEIILQNLEITIEALELWSSEKDAYKIEVSQFAMASQDILSNRTIILLAAKNEILSNVSILPEQFKIDKEIIMPMLKKNPLQIEHTPLNQDKEFLLEYLAENTSMNLNSVAQYITALGDEFLRSAIEVNGLLLEFASEEMISDRELVLKAISNTSLSLEFASDSFKQDFDIVMQCVKRVGSTLMHASDDLRKNRELVLEALKTGYFDEESIVWDEPEKILNYAMSRKPVYCISQLPETITSDRKFFEKVLSFNGDMLQFASEEIINDEDLVLLAVKTSCWGTLEFASNELQNDLLTILRARQLAIRNFTALYMAAGDWAPYIPQSSILTDNVWYKIVSRDFQRRIQAQFLIDCKEQNFDTKAFNDDYYSLHPTRTWY